MKMEKKKPYKRSFVIDYDQDGKPKRKWVYGTSKRDAEQKLHEAKQKYDAENIIDTKLIVSQWADKWYDTYTGHIQDRSRRIHRSNLDLHILPRIGHLLMSKVRPADIQQILNEEQGKSKSLGKI